MSDRDKIIAWRMGYQAGHLIGAAIGLLLGTFLTWAILAW